MKKSVLIFVIVLFSLLLFGSFVLAAEEAKRALEIKYPQIPGAPTMEYVDVGLPKYVDYVFRFSIVVFGLLVLGILIYNGVNYLLSFGNPTKMTDARQGITAGILGGLILFSAYLIFNTINPKLVTMELPPATIVKAIVTPGVYLCNYRVSIPGAGDIGDILINYMSENRETRNKAAKDLRTAMGTPDNKSKICFSVNYSAVLTNFTLKPGSPHTIFIVPEERYVEGRFKWEYNYAIVLHEENRFTGKCRLLPKPENNSIYRQVDNFQADIDFTVKSITIFKKPWQEPVAEAVGVTLYEGLGFNEIGWEEGKEGCATGAPGNIENGKRCKSNEECKSCNCVPFDPKKPGEGGMCAPKSGGFLPSLLSVLAAEDPNYLKRSFKPGGADILIVNEETLKEKFKSGSDKSLYHNTRSIRIEPKNGYLAILYGDALSGQGKDDKTKGEANERCEVRKTDDANLMDDTIGRCGNCGIIGWMTNWTGLTKCYPCLEYMIVVKGQVL